MSEAHKKKRFSALDAVIILVIIAAVAAVILYLTGGGTGDLVDINYTVEFKGIESSFEGIPQVGDVVYDSTKGYYMGVITNVRYGPATFYTWNNENNSYRQVTAPDEINCYLTITAEGRETNDVVSTSDGNVEIRVGKYVYVKGKGYANMGYVVDMATARKEAR